MQPNEIRSPPESRPIGTLLSDLSRDLTTLVRQELELAKTEASEKLSQLGSSVGSISVGGAIAFAGFLMLLHAAVYGLADLLGSWAEQNPGVAWVSYPWLPYLIVGLITLIIGFMMLKKGQNDLKAKNLTPLKTAESLRRDKDLIKEQLQ